MPCAVFLTHHNLQGSQTAFLLLGFGIGFLTHHNLQGSQTAISALFTFV